MNSSAIKIISLVFITAIAIVVVHTINQQGPKFIYKTFSGEIKEEISSKVKSLNPSVYRDSLIYYLNNKFKEIEEKLDNGSKVTFKEGGNGRFFETIDKAARDKELSAEELQELIAVAEESVFYE